MDLYTYEGPVTQFDRCIERNWSAVTQAPTEKKALNNLKYQYKANHNFTKTAKIELPGRLVKEGENV